MSLAWVIEHEDSEPSLPRYFTGMLALGLRWSKPGDHKAAVRYARKEDAEKTAISVDGAGKHRVCEHGWDEAVQP